MSAERYKVTTLANGREKHFIWDPTTPSGLDHGFQWVLENSDAGVRVRYLGNELNQIQPNSVISIKESSIASGELIPLKNELKLRIQRLKNIPPAFASPVDTTATSGSLQQLICFSGIGRALIGAQPVYSAYVAYARGRPIYTFIHTPEGYQVKPLLDGVRIKFKGQRSILGEIGKAWLVPANQIASTTVIRGSNWWRFSWVKTAAIIGDYLETDSLDDQQTKGLFKTLALFTLLFLLLLSAVLLAPRTEKPVEKPKEEPPVVQFIEPKKKMKLKSPPIKEPPPPPPKEKVKPPEPKPPKRVEPHKDVPKNTPPKEPPKETPKHVDKPPTPTKAKADAPAVKNVKVDKPAKTTAAPLPQTNTSQVIRSQATKHLKDVLGGAVNLAKSSVVPITTANSTATSLFNKGDVQIGATEIRPGAAPDSTKVGTIGGGKVKGGVGYSTSDQSAIGAAGSSSGSGFVPVETNNITVEEGLTRDEVGAVIHKHMDEIRYCHESAMLYNPRIEGKLLVQFTIGAQGNVEKASVQSTTVQGHILDSCILKRLVTWKFPHPKGGIRVSVSYWIREVAKWIVWFRL